MADHVVEIYARRLTVPFVTLFESPHSPDWTLSDGHWDILCEALGSNERITSFRFYRRAFERESIERMARLLSARSNIQSVTFHCQGQGATEEHPPPHTFFVDRLAEGIAESHGCELKHIDTTCAGSSGYLYRLIMRARETLQNFYLGGVVAVGSIPHVVGNELAAALATCSKLTHVQIASSSLHFCLLLPGLYQHASLKKLQLRFFFQPSADGATEPIVDGVNRVFDHVRTLISINTTLEQLNITWAGQPRRPSILAARLFDLATNSALKNVVLSHFTLTGEENGTLLPPEWCNSSVNLMGVAHCAIQAHAMQLFLRFTGLESLCFDSSSLNGLQDATDWSQLLQRNPNLSELRFTKCTVNNGIVAALATALESGSFPNLQLCLQLEQGEDYFALAALVEHCRIALLEIQMVRRPNEAISIPQHMATQIAHGLQRNTGLKALHLDAGESASLIFHALCQQATVEVVTLKVGGLEDGGSLSDLLRSNNPMHYLHLTCGRPNPVVMQALATGLTLNRCLKTLLLEAPLAHGDLSGFGSLVEDPRCNIQKLLLGGPPIMLPCNQCTGDELRSFFASVGRATSLKELRLPLLAKGGALIQSIVDALETNVFLQSLMVGRLVTDSVRHKKLYSFYLKLNASGRSLLKEAGLPASLWPHVLSHPRVQGDMDVLAYFAMRKVPEVIDGQALERHSTIEELDDDESWTSAAMD